MEHANADPARCIVPGCADPADQNCPLGLCTNCWWWAVDTLTEHQQATAPQRPQQRGIVYVVQVGDRIKIGFTTRPKQRLKAYPPGSTVLAVRPGALPIDERELHDRCAQYRVAGREWYRDSDEIRAIAAEMVAEHGQPPKSMLPTWGDGQHRERQTVGRARRGAVVHSKPWLT